MSVIQGKSSFRLPYMSVVMRYHTGANSGATRISTCFHENMTSIGLLRLSPPASEGDASKSSAIACELTSPLRENFMWSSRANVWDVEYQAGSDFVVARTASRLNFHETRQQGIAATMQALDIASVAQSMTSTVAHLGEHHITRFYEQGNPVVRYSAVMSHNWSASLHIERRDEQGNLVVADEPPPAVWHKAFRYYRLSQLSRDIYEAYRNLYLAYEALAESLYPRQREEREGMWVRRTLLEAHRQFDLSAFAPEKHANPSAFLFGTLYENVRCNLFHARTADSILPFFEVEAAKVQNAYQTLLALWRLIVNRALNLGGGGTVITQDGYASQMTAAFSEKLSIAVTDDATAIAETDTVINPGNTPTFELSECEYKGQSAPGLVSIESQELNVSRLPCIRRIGLTVNGTLYCLSRVKEGLTLGNVSAFQVHLGFRLTQNTIPRTEF